MASGDDTQVKDAPARDLALEVSRARSDYLAVSRCAHLYASFDDYEQAERAAWERLSEALARAEG